MSWWDAFVKGFAEFWNQPVPIIGFSVGAVVLGVLSIISKTAIGKKTLNSLKTGFDTAKNQFHEMLEKKDEIIKEIEAEKETIKLEYENYKIELKKQYEEKLVIVQGEKSKLEKLVLDIADNIHNYKVKDLVGEYIENGKTKIVEVSDAVETEFNNVIAEYKNEVADLKNEIANLKHEIEQEHNNIKEEVNEVVDSVNDVVNEVNEDAHEIVDEVIEDGKEITDTIKEEIC